MTAPARTVPCSRCRKPIPVPEAVLRDPGAVLVCPHCGQRHVRKRPSGSVPTGHLPVSGMHPGIRQTQDSVPTVAATTSSPGPMAAAAMSPALAEASSTPSPAPSEEGHIFSGGTLVAGRYRVVRFLARGGMGEVYEVEDLELRERLALKTVHPAIAREPGVLDRFKREVHLARKVTHPNVCRLFDLGYHQFGPGREPVAFLTMEMLEGESLSSRMRRLGRMSPTEVLPLARQMAVGLQAAHDAGIVHRDFKPDNVFLVGQGDGQERVVITDFGIARPRSSQGDLAMATLTAAGTVVGTPAYMAPEQVTGEEVGAASDQYALGIVLYEMLSGELPFRGETPIATAAKRLTERPTPLSQLVPELPGHWIAAIARALNRDAQKRFPTVTAFIDALEQRGSSSFHLETGLTQRQPVQSVGVRSLDTRSLRFPDPEVKRRPIQWRRGVLAALLLALIGVSAWAIWRVREVQRQGEVVRPFLARRSLAVLPLENLTGREDLQWLGSAFAEMLGTELGQSREIRVVSGARVREWFEQRGNSGRGTAQGSPQLASDYAVAGSFVTLPASDSIRVDLRLEDTKAQETLLSLAEQGRTADLFELVARVGSKLRERLGASSRPSSLAALFPRSGDAARLYVEALETQRRGEVSRSRELLERVVAQEPNNALAHAALAAAWSALGFEGRAREVAQRALDLAAALPEFDRLAIEARHAELNADWVRASVLWRALRDTAPDVSDFTLALARAELAAGQPQRAVEALEAYQRIPGLEADPRLELEMGKVQGALGNPRGQEEAATRALEAAQALGLLRLESEARLQLAWAYRQLGMPDQALNESRRVEELAEQLGDAAIANQAVSIRAALLLDRGELQEAIAASEQALNLARERGSRIEIAQALNNLAVAFRRRGWFERSLEQYEEAARVAREVGNRRGTALALTNQAAVLVERGDLTVAEQRLQEAAAVFRELQDVVGLAAAEASLGGVLRRKGMLDEATKLLERLLKERRQAGERSAEFGLLLALGQVELDRGRIVRAEPLLLEALGLAEQLGQRTSAGQARLALAEAHDLAGSSEEATKELLTAIAVFSGAGQPALADRARLSLSRIELRSDPKEALRRVDEVEGRWAGQGPAELRVLGGIVRAEVLLAQGQATAALKSIESLDGSLAGRRLELELELLRLRALVASGKARDARARLEALRDLSRQGGYLGVALEAAFELYRLGNVPAQEGRGELMRQARQLGLERLATALERLAS